MRPVSQPFQKNQRPPLLEPRLRFNRDAVNVHRPRLVISRSRLVGDDKARALDRLMRRLGVAGDVQDVEGALASAS